MLYLSWRGLGRVGWECRSGGGVWGGGGGGGGGKGGGRRGVVGMPGVKILRWAPERARAAHNPLCHIS